MPPRIARYLAFWPLAATPASTAMLILVNNYKHQKLKFLVNDITMYIKGSSLLTLIALSAPLHLDVPSRLCIAAMPLFFTRLGESFEC